MRATWHFKKNAALIRGLAFLCRLWDGGLAAPPAAPPADPDFARFRGAYPARHRPVTEGEWAAAKGQFAALVDSGIDRDKLAASANVYAATCARRGWCHSKWVLSPAGFLRGREFERFPPFTVGVTVAVTIGHRTVVAQELTAAQARAIGQDLIAAADLAAAAAKPSETGEAAR